MPDDIEQPGGDEPPTGALPPEMQEALRRLTGGAELPPEVMEQLGAMGLGQIPVAQFEGMLSQFQSMFSGPDEGPSDGDTSISFTWKGATTEATLTFEPGRGLGGENTTPVATLAWRDSAGEHRADDLIANPPVVA